MELLEQAGVQEQDAAKVWYSLDTNISFYDEAKRVEITALPSTKYEITTLIDFNSPVLGTQHAGLKTMKEFRSEIAPAALSASCMNWRC